MIKLPSSLTTVTRFSKLMAGVLFIVFIISAFFAGMKYQAMTDLIKIKQSNLITAQPSPTPANLANDSLILFEKEEGWGPCPPEDRICRQSTKLYSSGKLVLEGAKIFEKQLDKEKMEKIKNQIKLSNVIFKNCSAGIILDYTATYILNIDGQIKTIKYPGCENELKRIEELINQ